MATANALMPNRVPMVDDIVNSGATMIPAIPARKPESANDSMTTCSTSMPMSRAASRFCTTASRALPYWKRWKKICSAVASSRPTAGINNCKS